MIGVLNVRKIYLFVLLILILLLTTGCSSEKIELNKENFENYFAIQFDLGNSRLERPSFDTTYSLCDLTIKIDKTTNHDLNNVEIELRIFIEEGDYRDTDFTRIIKIPVGGTVEHTEIIQTHMRFMQQSGIISPNIADIKYELISVKGYIE